MKYTDEYISRVKDANDIVDVIGKFIDLKKSGVSMLGLCPFHGEKTPSFSVKPEGQFFKCFGCDVRGDVIEFLQRQEEMSFSEAVRWLAKRAGIPSPTSTTEVFDSMPADIADLVKFAGGYFIDALWDNDSAREYLAKRKIDEDIVESFGVGYASEDWRSLYDAAIKAGFTDKQLQSAGLLGSSNGRVYDWFRSRIVFPLLSIDTELLGFGGRTIIPDEIPKYLNTPETDFFKRGRQLFGYPICMEGDSKLPPGVGIVVEGYFDDLRLTQLGYNRVVSTCGTSVTQEQSALLGLKFSEMWLCSDSDLAGNKFIWNAMPMLFAAGVRVRILSLPDNHDPDTFGLERGSDGIEELFEDSISAAAMYVDGSQKGAFGEPEKVIANSIDTIVDPFFRESFIDEIRDLDISLFNRVNARRETPQIFPNILGTSTIEPDPETKLRDAEKLVISSMFSSKEMAETTVSLLKEEDFEDTLCKGIFSKMETVLLVPGDLDLSDDMLLIVDETDPPDKSGFIDCVDKIKKRSFTKVRDKIRLDIADDPHQMLDSLSEVKSQEIEFKERLQNM